ncbi:MAG: hypothetical protein ACPGDB_04400, partial [Fusobacterium sp.]
SNPILIGANEEFHNMITDGIDVPFRDEEGNDRYDKVYIFDFNNMTRAFRINQKWMYDKFSRYINLTIVGNKKNTLFDKTFMPQRFRFTDKQLGRERALKFNVKYLDNILVNSW